MDDIRERTASFHVTRAKGDDDKLSLEGYAAVFGASTLISSVAGEFEEVIAPGAFRRSIAQKGARGIRLQFDHGRHPLLGSIPLGVIDELEEDERGLRVRATLTDNWLIAPVRDAIRDGSVDGMSFRFRVVDEDVDKDADPELRTVREVELFEVGPVVWPAYEQTSVGVRGREIAEALLDPELRVEIARALMADVGTSEGRAEAGTPDERAGDDGPSDEGTRRVLRPAEVLRALNEWEGSR